MSRTARAILLARTVRHLAPEQVGHRVRLRVQKVLVQAAPSAAARLMRRAVPDDLGWPQEFAPVDARVPDVWPSADELGEGRITLLGHERVLDDWRCREAPQLWRYHLHYWDWAWSLALAEDAPRGREVFERLFRTWQQQTRFGYGDEWSPYVVALRAWSWCGQYDRLVRGSATEREFVHLLGLHQGYLRANLERDVGGNHLLKDVKALVGLAVFFHDGRALQRALQILEREVRRQVLPDGGHYERAPAYHCQVLGDLIDLKGLLGRAAPAFLVEAVRRMQRWLGLVLLPDGSVPLLNDGFPVHSAYLEVLEPGSPAGEGLTMLPDSGLGVARRGPWFLLADVGDPCPDELPAHAHADTLGFLLYHQDLCVVGEAFTSTYRPVPRRAFERGTAAHSTAQVDGVNSTEVWGVFRAARRARPTLQEAEDTPRLTKISASHDGFSRLPGSPVHARTWLLDSEGLRVEDRVDGLGRHRVQVRLYGSHEHQPAVVGADFREQPVQVAAGWEQLTGATALLHEEVVDLPWQINYQITTRGVA